MANGRHVVCRVPTQYDMFEKDNYAGVEQVIKQSLKHIKAAVENLERIRDVRFRSPYHPNRIVRWFEKRSTTWWLWAAAMPILLPILYAVCARVFVDFGIVPGAIVSYAFGLALILGMRFTAE